jgi:hypothetical protein
VLRFGSEATMLRCSGAIDGPISPDPIRTILPRVVSAVMS